MLIYFGADHRGTGLKDQLLLSVKDMGYETLDLHPDSAPDDDYPDIAALVAEKISADPDSARGILICGSGAGMDIAANKFNGIRSVLGINADQIYDARHDDDANILTLAADFTDSGEAEKMTRIFLSTPFAGEERFTRRIGKIKNIEDRNG